MRNAVSQAVSAVSRGIGSVRRCGVPSTREAALLADFGEDGIFALRADTLANSSAVLGDVLARRGAGYGGAPIGIRWPFTACLATARGQYRPRERAG